MEDESKPGSLWEWLRSVWSSRAWLGDAGGFEAEVLMMRPRIGHMMAHCARQHIGRGEVGINNGGDYVRRLTGGRVGAWCAAFVWTVIQDSCDKLAVPNPIRRTNNARRLSARILQAGGWDTTEEPAAGDVALWRRGPPPFGHTGIIIQVDTTSRIMTVVEGNRGRFPATVQAFRRSLTDRDLLSIVRVPG